MLDLTDGGISLLLRCPGYLPSADTAISLEDLTIDVYVSPRELSEGGRKMSERVALIVQEFGEHLALPHLCRFQNRCVKDDLKALPAPGVCFLSPEIYSPRLNFIIIVVAAGKSISVDGSSHLPDEHIVGSGYIRCRCRPAGTLVQDIAIHKLGPSQLSSGIMPRKLTRPKVTFNISGGNDAVVTGRRFGEFRSALSTSSEYL